MTRPSTFYYGRTFIMPLKAGATRQGLQECTGDVMILDATGRPNQASMARSIDLHVVRALSG